METIFSPSPFELLAFYVESGVDEAIGSQAIDRFSLPVPGAKTGTPPGTPPGALPKAAAVAVQTVAAVSPPAAVASVPLIEISTRMAQACGTLAELRQALESFDALPICRSALHLVFADGVPQAPVMIIGEAPGVDEDAQGVPFVGKGGKLLDRMLDSIGLDRAENVYLTNAVPWRPMGNPIPSAEEIAVCRPFLLRHIQLAAPQIVVLLGGVAAQAALGAVTGIARLRGQWQDLRLPQQSLAIPAMTTFNPRYLLQTPSGKSMAWRDLILVQKRLAALK